MKKFFGYIEGYYGRMLSWDERTLLIDTLHRLSLTTYLYAPKEDPLHRKEWRRPYSAAWMAELARLAAHAARSRVTVIPALAPGLTYDYTSRADYTALLRKFTAFVKSGLSTVALLMDDIPDKLPAGCQRRFSSLGEAHGRLAAALLDDLRRIDPRVILWFCPTIYADQFAGGDAAASPYLNDLARTAPRDIVVMWTGPRIVSPELTRRTVRKIAALFGGNLVIWDNFYANDYCPRRLFAGPYQGRGRDLLTICRGVLLNPTGLVHTDALLLELLAGFAQGGNAAVVWRRVMAHHAPREIITVAPFFMTPFNDPAAHLTPRAIERCRAALAPLIWEWKAPLQREWYPFLAGLDADLALCQQTARHCIDLPWVSKKYPAVLAGLLLAGRRRAAASVKRAAPC